ncbi:hypothetical protein BASA61_002785 [Batrachochytrium salamandrivorans]|nr:hypothetical protein BASA61_002785 [Batrachochytrium salamandrivorans]
MHSISPTITSPITSPTTTPATIPTITLTIFGTGIFPKICKTRDILNSCVVDWLPSPPSSAVPSHTTPPYLCQPIAQFTASIPLEPILSNNISSYTVPKASAIKPPRLTKATVYSRFTTAVSQNEIQPLFANLYA